MAASATRPPQARDDVAAAEQELADAEAALAEVEPGTTAPDDDRRPPRRAARPARVGRPSGRGAGRPRHRLRGRRCGHAAHRSRRGGERGGVRARDRAGCACSTRPGCLTDEQQAQAVDEIGSYTSALQTSLTTAGLYDGPIDGVYGPGTRRRGEAAADRQRPAGHRVRRPGDRDRPRRTRWRPPVPRQARQAIAHTAAVQSLLTLAGYWTGPIDGEWTDALTAARRGAAGRPRRPGDRGRGRRRRWRRWRTPSPGSSRDHHDRGGRGRHHHDGALSPR